MDPIDPADAQQIVIAYARMLERDIAEGRHPARVDSLPFAKPIIKSAIETSVRHLSLSGQLTDELQDYLETAYASLADYLDVELVQLIGAYRASAEQLAADRMSSRDKAQTAAWLVLAESGALAGEIARAATAEADALRREFHDFLTRSPSVQSM